MGGFGVYYLGLYGFFWVFQGDMGFNDLFMLLIFGYFSKKKAKKYKRKMNIIMISKKNYNML